MRLRFAILLASISVVSEVSAAETVKVTASRFADIAIHEEASAPATVISLNNASLPAQISAQITGVQARVGDKVRKGDILVELDCRQMKSRKDEAHAAVKANKARLVLAEYQLERAQNLRKKNHISEEVLRSRQAEQEVLKAESISSKAALSSARLNVEHCKIVAPFTGTVTERHGSVGDWVMQGAVVMTLVDLDMLEVAADVATAQAEGLRQAESLQFLAAGQNYKLKLRAVVPVIESRARTQNVRLEFVSQKAVSGQAGRLLWKQAEPSLPADLLVARQGELGVFLYDDGKAVFHPVKHAQEGRPAVVNLNGDTQVIIKGRYTVIDNQPVSITR